MSTKFTGPGTPRSSNGSPDKECVRGQENRKICRRRMWTTPWAIEDLPTALQSVQFRQSQVRCDLSSSVVCGRTKRLLACLIVYYRSISDAGRAPPRFWQIINPIPTGGADYVHHITTGSSIFYDLPPPLYIVVASEARASSLSFLSKCSAAAAATVFGRLLLAV